jgi:hypothetical protein
VKPGQRVEVACRFLDPKAAPNWQSDPNPRIAETVALGLNDVRLSACKGTLRVHGKGHKIREIPTDPQLRTDLQLWLDERPNWPGAQHNSALLLNRRGRWLTTRSASRIFHTIADAAGLEEDTTAHMGQYTFATTLIRGGTRGGGSAWPVSARRRPVVGSGAVGGDAQSDGAAVVVADRGQRFGVEGVVSGGAGGLRAVVGVGEGVGHRGGPELGVGVRGVEGTEVSEQLRTRRDAR